MNENELMHYGVIGMKWGIRRARSKNAKDTYKKAADKARQEYRQSKDQNQPGAKSKYRNAIKNARLERKHNMKDRSGDVEIANKLYSKQEKAANSAVAKMSTGKALVQASLLSSYGALKYNEAKARGASTGKAVVSSYLHSMGNYVTGGLTSTMQYLDNRDARKR